MNRKTSRLLSLLLVLILTITLFPINVGAVITYNSGGSSYKCEFTSFEDLQNLVEAANPRITWAIYTGTGPLIIEQDLTLYPDLYLDSISQKELQIPAGVAFRTSSSIVFDNIVVDGTLYANELRVDNLTVNGAIFTESLNNYESLRGTGTIKCSNICNVYFPGIDAFDLDKIDLRNANRASLAFNITTVEEMEAVLAMALQDSREIVTYGCNMLEPVTIEKSFTIPQNIDFGFQQSLTIQQGSTVEFNGNVGFFQPVTIQQGCTLQVNKIAGTIAPLIIEGSLINDSTFMVNGLEGGAIAFSNTSTYSGTGELAVYCESRDMLPSVISGIDLSEFMITERNDADWETGLFEHQRWHLEYIGPGYVQPEAPTNPNLPSIAGIYTTDIIMSAAELSVDAPDAHLQATLFFTDEGQVSTTWTAVDVTALQKFFHGMFVNTYYAMAYNAGITDINEIEAFCMESTGMSVSAYMEQFVPYDAIRIAFTPMNTSGSYTYNDTHTAIFTDIVFMDVPSNISTENSFVVTDGTLYLNAASWGKPDYTFVCTAK